MDSLAERIQILSIQFVPFMMAVVFHEYAHGLIAKRWGDTSAQAAGRLTLNPIAHIDPIGTLLFPIFNMLSGINLLFGWAKPVPIDPSQFRKYRSGLFWVSIAGPAMNILLAFFSALLFCGIRKWMSPEFYLYEPLLAMTFVSVSLNYALALFNLIPLPPLDGGRVITALLPTQASIQFSSIEPYSFWILMALLLTGALSILAGPIQFFTQFTLGVMSWAFL